MVTVSVSSVRDASRPPVSTSRDLCKKPDQPEQSQPSPRSGLRAAARTRLGSFPPSGTTLIEFETQSMLQSNCIVNQCLSEPRQWSGPSSRCAASDLQWCNLLSVHLHCSDHPLGTDLRDSGGSF